VRDDGALVELRCSAIVFRGEAVLLLGRRRDHTRDWVLPGGHPPAPRGRRRLRPTAPYLGNLWRDADVGPVHSERRQRADGASP
jgi:hypothetical protein